MGKKYVGGTTNLRKRYLQYKNSESTTQEKVINSINEYGFNKHEFIVLERVEKGLLKAKEHEYGMTHDVLGENGLNSMLPKCNADFKTVSKDSIEKRKKYKPTKETLARMSDAQKNRECKEETKEKLRQFNLGKTQSEETKLKKNNILKGQKRSEETRRRMSLAQTGRVMTEAQKENLRLKNKGKVISEETRKKISLSNMGKVCNDFTKQRISEASSKIIVDLQTGIFYNSASELAELIKVKRTTLTAKLSGQNKNNTPYIYI